ncbi:hypothetical protein [Desulfuromonas acetoxidans]|nr:hypothetical protein [Desulfuromonas acetoxidans]MBF0646603.1 hypothetical protein [Desulfuromonas acetoxidans]NVD25367.1 hypothetical protein [Desulfuromonas acetoxidans]NVE17419.1 hypothetical protein [Desulfuromonas acetoxidans]
METEAPLLKNNQQDLPVGMNLAIVITKTWRQHAGIPGGFMYTKLSKLMTLFGLCAMGFYAIMLSSGQFSVEVLPQFALSAVFFLSSGRMMKKVARRIRAGQSEQDEDQANRIDLQLLSWVVGIALLMVLSLLLLVPFGVTIEHTYLFKVAHQLFDSALIP